MSHVSVRRHGAISALSAALIFGIGGVSSAAVAPTGDSAPRAQAAGAARCSTPWGTGAKGARPVALSRENHLVGVRAGRHECFDRLVVDLDGTLARKGYSVRYVRTVTQDGSGEPVALRGRAAIEVVIGAPAYDDAGQPTYVPRNPKELVNTRGFHTLRQAALAGSFEGQTTIGVGVAKRTPMRAFVLRGAGGDRLVIDVAHR